MIREDLDKFKLALAINIELMLTNRKFIALCIFFAAINVIPGILVFAISSITDIYKIATSMYEILAIWQITLTSNILSIILPLYASNTTLGEQMRKRTLFNLVSRPIRREIISLSFVASATIVIALIGLLLGSIQYIALYISTRISGILVPVPTELIYQTAALLIMLSPLYVTLASLILVMVKDFGIKTMIIYFFLTLLYDLILIALGGNYVYLTVTHYRNSILYSLTLNHLYKENIMNSMLASPTAFNQSISVLLIPFLVLLVIFVRVFSTTDIE